MMNAVLRPFDLPVPPGAPAATGLALVDTPDPALGAIVSATSTLDLRGYSVRAEDAPASTGGRIAFAAGVGGIGGAIVGAIVAYALLSMLPWKTAAQLGTPIFWALILLGAGLFFTFLFKRWGRGRQLGRCVYAGVEGVEVLDYKKGAVTRARVRYADEMMVFGARTKTFINGHYSYDLDSLSFRDARGTHLLTLVETYHEADGPSAVGLQVRQAIALAAQARAPLVQAKLQDGQAVTFPVVEFRGTSAVVVRRLVLQGDSLELHDGASGATPRTRYPLASVEARLAEGKLELVSRDAAQPGASFELATVSDADVLLMLVSPAAG